MRRPEPSRISIERRMRNARRISLPELRVLLDQPTDAIHRVRNDLAALAHDSLDEDRFARQKAELAQEAAGSVDAQYLIVASVPPSTVATCPDTMTTKSHLGSPPGRARRRRGWPALPVGGDRGHLALAQPREGAIQIGCFLERRVPPVHRSSFGAFRRSTSGAYPARSPKVTW